MHNLNEMMSQLEISREIYIPVGFVFLSMSIFNHQQIKETFRDGKQLLENNLLPFVIWCLFTIVGKNSETMDMYYYD